MKTAIYRGQRFNVISEDGKYVTLESFGYRKRHLKDEVVFEEAPKDEIVSEYPADKLIKEQPKEELPGEVADKSLIVQEGEDSKIASLEIAIAREQEKLAKLKLELSKVKGDDKPVVAEMEETAEKTTTLPADEVDRYKQVGVDVAPETSEDRKKENDKRMSTALAGLRTSFRKMLNEIDDILESDNGEIINDKDAESQDVNYSSLDNTYGALDVDNQTSFEPKLEEEGGTVSAAAPGCAGGIEAVPAKLGMKNRYEDMYEALKVESEFQLDESARSATLNRHAIAEKVEQEIDPLVEGKGDSLFERRKARVEAIGRFATLKECAKFLSENKFDGSSKKYVKRTKCLNESELLEKMQKKAAQIMGRIKKI